MLGRLFMKIKYNCIFDVKQFPFDGQNCYFIMKMNQHKDNAFSFVDDGGILYNGSSNVDQFSVGQMHIKIENTNKFDKYILYDSDLSQVKYVTWNSSLPKEAIGIIKQSLIKCTIT